MGADRAQGSSATKFPALNDRLRSEESDEVIDALSELLSSGRPLSEVLDSAKRLTLEGNGRSDTLDLVDGEVRSASAPWKIVPVSERIEPRLTESPGVLGGGTKIDAPRGPVGLKVPQAPKSTLFEKGWCSRLIGAALFWLIPTMSLAVMGTATELLLDADLTRTAAEATAILKAIPVTLDRDLPPPAPIDTEAGIATPTPRSAAAIPIVPERTQERSETVHPTEHGVDRSPAGPATEVASIAQASVPEGSLTASEAGLAAPEVRPEPAHAAAQVVTGSPAEAVAKIATARQNRIQHRGPFSVGTGKRAGRGWVSSARATPIKGRRIRTQRHITSPICPHSGHCLTPP